MSVLDDIFSSPIALDGHFAQIRSQSDSPDQAQTNASFSEKWSAMADKAKSSAMETFQKSWLLDLYGFKTVETLKSFLNDKRVVVDAGCGLGYKSAWMAECSPSSLVIGVDFSEAAQIAAKRYADVSNLYFARGDIANLPLKQGSVDFILCDQVIHHTTVPKATFGHLASLLKPGGKLACYVYAKKALPRELVDDHFRKATHQLTHEQMWEFASQLTKLGKALSDLNVKFTAPDVPVLGIKGGEYDLQRFIYWNFLKCFWRADWSTLENDSCNFDWYSPSQAERYSPDEFRAWASELDLSVDFFRSEEACHTMIASK